MRDVSNLAPPAPYLHPASRARPTNWFCQELSTVRPCPRHGLRGRPLRSGLQPGHPALGTNPIPHPPTAAQLHCDGLCRASFARPADQHGARTACLPTDACMRADCCGCALRWASSCKALRRGVAVWGDAQLCKRLQGAARSPPAAPCRRHCRCLPAARPPRLAFCPRIPVHQAFHQIQERVWGRGCSENGRLARAHCHFLDMQRMHS